VWNRVSSPYTLDIIYQQENRQRSINATRWNRQRPTQQGRSRFFLSRDFQIFYSLYNQNGSIKCSGSNHGVRSQHFFSTNPSNHGPLAGRPRRGRILHARARPPRPRAGRREPGRLPALDPRGAGAPRRGRATLDQIVAVLGPAGGHAHATLASHVALRVFADGAGTGSGGPTLRFANGIWIDEALQPNADYARVLSEHYRAESSSLPFKSMVSSSPPIASISLLLIRYDLPALTVVSFLDQSSQMRQGARSTSGSRPPPPVGSRSSSHQAPSAPTRQRFSPTRSTSRAPGRASSRP
jgi:hypothetical protein